MYIIGTSLGGNYVLRYLFSHKAPKIKGLALISPPFDVKYVINEGMNIHYQKMFIKYYL
jgi:alpha-beta hydrolase superfamily lysophospholipase